MCKYKLDFKEREALALCGVLRKNGVGWEVGRKAVLQRLSSGPQWGCVWARRDAEPTKEGGEIELVVKEM